MYINWVLIAGFTIALGLGSKQANSQTVEDCAAIADKEIRQECFEAAFKNKPAQEGPSDQEKVEQAWADMKALADILNTYQQNPLLQINPISICKFVVDISFVNETAGKRFDTEYTIDMSQLYAAETNSKIRFNDTVLITAERSNPISREQNVFSSDGSTFLESNSSRIREAALTPRDPVDQKELLETLQRSISRCKSFDQGTLSQGEQIKGKAATTSNPLLGFFQIEASVGELGVYDGGRKCLDWALIQEIRPDGSTSTSSLNTVQCTFAVPIPEGALAHQTDMTCHAKYTDGTKRSTQWVQRLEWQGNKMVSSNIDIPESRLVHVKCIQDGS